MTLSTSQANPDPITIPIDALPPVLFFDGECGLCNRSVRWLLARDRRRVLHFAPLQGRMAAQKLVVLPSDYKDWAVALWDEDGIHYESDAMLRAVAHLGGLWRLARLLLIIPRVIRNGVYRFVARNRIRWFGRVDSCALLSAEDRARLLP
jgi:predicted DCC family thiol-disulfide oxidoreductase YuxK